jgi:hypothetical protein
MSVKYKKLIFKCIVLAALLVCLIALPRSYQSKAGMSQNEYDAKIAKASDALLYSNNKAERQIAVSQANNLYKYQKEGRIEQVKNYTELLSLARFGIILTILLISWNVLRTVYREVNLINGKHKPKPKESSAV